MPVLDETTIDFRQVGGAVGGFTFNVPEKQHVTRGTGDPAQPPPTEPQVRQALYKVNDPEVGVVEHVFSDDVARTLEEFRLELYSASFDSRRLQL